MTSKEKKNLSEAKQLGMDSRITRRDFVGGTLVGAGAGLLAMAAPGCRAPTVSEPSSAPAAGWPPTGFDTAWTGPGGIGDYATSNGNTHAVVNSAHAIGQKRYVPLPKETIDTSEVYDVVAVGGGFAGLSTGYTAKEQGNERVLILDNHPIFGGEGKMNAIDVDGTTLYAPQGSNDFCLPTAEARAIDFVHPYWDKLGIPSEFDFVDTHPRISGKIKIARDNFGPQVHQIHEASLSHYYFSADGKGGSWAHDPWSNGFKDAPIPEVEKSELMRFIADHKIPAQAPSGDFGPWLDSMSYKDYIEKVMGYSPKVSAFMDDVCAAGATGAGCDAMSAYVAWNFVWPGTAGFLGEEGAAIVEKLQFATFPGGNAGIARFFVKAIFPDAIAGEHTIEDIHNNAIDFTAFDRPSNQVRMRLGSTVVYVKHDGDPESAETVTVAYEKDGKVYSVKARSVVMCSGAWVNKHICQDLTPEIQAAHQHFNHGPMLTVNVAVRNWRFLERLGSSAVRWFGGEMGFWVNIRQPMQIGSSTMPLDPDKPLVLSHYVPFPTGGQGLDAGQQGMLGRVKLLSMPYADIESWVRRHYTQMFGQYGFDAERDVGAIITNRWGHAYMSAPPGFHFDRDGNRSPMNTIQAGYGRVFFGHSETSGRQLWNVGVEQGRRATMQALAKL
ncbi:MAG: FAD-binding protein [Myxococcales bacterium]|nr:FAD-binding protein [Myxococcales bacterium]